MQPEPQAHLTALLLCRSVEFPDGPMGTADVRGIGDALIVSGGMPAWAPLRFFVRYAAPAGSHLMLVIAGADDGTSLFCASWEQEVRFAGVESSRVIEFPIEVESSTNIQVQLRCNERLLGVTTCEIRLLRDPDGRTADLAPVISCPGEGPDDGHGQ